MIIIHIHIHHIKKNNFGNPRHNTAKIQSKTKQKTTTTTMNTNQILSRPKIQRGKRRARRKKITPTITKKQNNAIPPQNQTTVVFTQDSVSNNNKKYNQPKNSRQMQAQNIAAMAAARVNRLNSATSRPKSPFFK